MKGYTGFLIAFCLFHCYVHAGPPNVKFIENKGQWPAQVLYEKSLGNGNVFFETDQVLFSFVDLGGLEHPDHSHSTHDPKEAEEHETSMHTPHEGVKGHAYSLQFLNSIVPECVEGQGVERAKINYLLGNDPNKWVSNASTYSSIFYGNVYHQVDFHFSQNGDHLKYDVIVRPGADPSDIVLSYTGTEGIQLDRGNLIVRTSIGYTTELKPYAYQVIDGQVIKVECSYSILGGNKVQFVFPKGYNDCYELIIDPILIFSTYSGSTYDNWGNTASYDAQGNLYSGGMVSTTLNAGTSFPITTGAYQQNFGGSVWDMGLLKFDSTGSELLYATYLGGNRNETPQSIVVDSDGSLLILGATSSTDFPVTNTSSYRGGADVEPLGAIRFVGADMFISKLSPDGSALSASTYLAGTANDAINFISGVLNTPDGPNNGKQESPLARNYGDQLRGDILLDDQGNVYVASNSLSPDFLDNENILNTFNGGDLDAVVVKLNPLLDVLWARFMGGSGDDAAYSVKLNSMGDVIVSGGTTSTNFPGMENGWQDSLAGNVDGWIQRLSTDGMVLSQGTYLGTPVYDQAYFIDVDVDDNIFVYGQTQGPFPVFGNVYTEANGGQFLQKFNADLSSAEFSTTFGSGGLSPDISPTAFLVNECNNIYLAGWGGNTNIPVVFNNANQRITRNFVGGNTRGLTTSPDALDRTTQGNDFYLMVLSGDASEFLYGTFLGGETSSTHVDGGTSRFDRGGIVYHAVCAGCGGQPTDFPATPGAWSERNLSQNCNNAAFKFDLASLRADFVTNTTAFDNPGISSVCLGDPIVFQNRSIGGVLYEWDFGDGTDLVRQDTVFVVHQYQNAGIYNVVLRASDPNTCISEDFAFGTVRVVRPNFSVIENAAVCAGDELRLFASGADNYTWVSEDSTFTSNDRTPLVSPTEDTRYFVRLRLGPCVEVDTVDVRVIPGVEFDFSVTRLYDCWSRASVQVTNLRPGQDVEFTWALGDGTVNTESTYLHEYNRDGDYVIQLRATREFCTFQQETSVRIRTIEVPNVITPSSPGDNDTFIIRAPDRVQLRVFNRWGRRVYENGDYQNEWAGDGLPAGVYFYEADVLNETTCKGWIQVIK